LSGDESGVRGAGEQDFAAKNYRFYRKISKNAKRMNPLRGSNPRTYPFSVIGKVRDTTSPNGPPPGDVRTGLFDIYTPAKERGSEKPPDQIFTTF
jgi:hypothetical protein